MTLLYIDNNALRVFLQNERNLFDLAVFEVMRDESGQTYSIKSSPYIILEAIGIKASKLVCSVKIPTKYYERIISYKNNNDTEKMLKAIEDLVVYTYSGYENQIKNHPKLSQSNIQEATVTQKNYVHDEMLDIYKDAIEDHIIVPEFIEFVQTWLALDFFLNHNFRKLIRD